MVANTGVIHTSDSQNKHASRLRSRKHVNQFLNSLLTHLVLILFGLIFILPIYWMVTTALKPNTEMFVIPPKWFPSTLIWERFPQAFTFIPFAQYTLNTLYVSLYNVVATVISCTLVAYSFGVLKWKGRDFFFVVLIATMILPYQVTLIPQYIIFSKLKWVGTFLPLTFPAWFGNAFFVFLLRQFYLSIPEELLDAARMDGASDLGILLRIVVPLSQPALATMAIFTFMGNWNDFIGPLIYLTKQSTFTLSIGLYNFIGNVARTEWGLLLAASTMITIPPVILFFFAQRSFIEGITMTGIKG
jgi:multiple sugar transport system permease protein